MMNRSAFAFSCSGRAIDDALVVFDQHDLARVLTSAWMQATGSGRIETRAGEEGG